MKNPPAAKKRPERGVARKSAAARRNAVAEGSVGPEGDEGPATLPQGTLWARITARSTDALLLLLPFFLLLQKAIPPEADTVTTRNDGYLWLAGLMVIGYEVIFTGIWGWTPGKRLIGLAVIDPETGEPPGWGKVVMRAMPLVLVVTVLFIPLLWLACVIAMRVDKRQRSVFDFTGGTAVVATAERAR
jgi:uncharacterized RDD family membrane protein YckC